MTFAELEDAIKTVLPTASLAFDNEGQIIIYTGLMPLEEDDPEGDLIEFTSEEELGTQADENEDDADSDFEEDEDDESEEENNGSRR